MNAHYLILTLIMLIGMSVLLAHPPSSILVSFDKAKSLLEVSFKQNVQDTATHYIEKIDVKVNKKAILMQKLNSQDSKDGGMVYYKVIDLKVGDMVTATGTCNKFGSKTETYEIK